MNEPLYYFDAYTTQFMAQVQEQVRENGRCALILDQTYFYPTSGGQPHDTGHIAGVNVTAVSVRNADGAILHWLETDRPLSGEITAEINWPRRFDHMQQHTGQHILSQSLWRVARAETVSFHLSQNSVTIDLDTPSLTSAQLAQAEDLANQVVWENRPVQARLVSLADAQQMPVRKIPSAGHGQLRLVEIADFDLTACGGTHVAATGAVGLIKLIRRERRGEQWRLEFCCGQRALQDYRQAHTIVYTLMADLTTGAADVVTAVSRLRQENKSLQRDLKNLQNALLTWEARQLVQDARITGGIHIVTQVFADREPGVLRTLAQHLTRQERVVALLGLAGPKSQLLFARSNDAPGDMSHILKPALRALGTASGGGKVNIAQGGGLAASVLEVQQAIQVAEKLLTEQIWSK